jgi:hypothetical protein
LSNPIKDIKAKCDMILHAIVGPNAIDIWWNSPNQAFDMKPAKEMFLEDPKRVYRYLLNQVQR